MKHVSSALRRFSSTTIWLTVIALVAAASATAGGMITGAQIENGSIRGIDVRDGSLGWGDLSNGVKNRLVNRAASKVQASALPGSANAGAAGANGKDGAPGLNGKDGSNGVDGKDGAPGQNGAPGSNGSNGANGAPGLSNVYVTNRTIVVPANSTGFEHIRACQDGQVAISGGHTIVSGNAAVTAIVSAPHALTDHAAAANGNKVRTASSWRHVFTNSSAAGVEVLPWVICADVS